MFATILFIVFGACKNVLCIVIVIFLHWLIILVPPVMFTIEPRVVSILKARSPLSFKHMFAWYPFLDPHITILHSNIGACAMWVCMMIQDQKKPQNWAIFIGWEQQFGPREFTIGFKSKVRKNEVTRMWHHFLTKSFRSWPKKTLHHIEKPNFNLLASNFKAKVRSIKGCWGPQVSCTHTLS